MVSWLDEDEGHEMSGRVGWRSLERLVWGVYAVCTRVIEVSAEWVEQGGQTLRLVAGARIAGRVAARGLGAGDENYSADFESAKMSPFHLFGLLSVVLFLFQASDLYLKTESCSSFLLLTMEYQGYSL